MTSAECKDHIVCLRAESKDEIILRLEVALEEFCHLKAVHEQQGFELLTVKKEAEDLRRDLLNRKSHGPKIEEKKQTIAPYQKPIEFSDDIAIDEDDENRTNKPLPNVPSKFAAKNRSRGTVPDGAGGTKTVLSTLSGKNIIY